MTVQDLIERGIELKNEGEFEAAAKVFQQAFKKAPKDWRLPNEAGVCLQQVGRHGDAAALYEVALPLAPDRPFVQFNVGLAWLQAGELDNARRALEAVLADDPDNIKAAFELGVVAMKRRAWDDAIALFDQALGFDVLQNGHNAGGSEGMDAELHRRVFLNRARIFGIELGQTERAVRELDRLIELDDKGRVFTLASEAKARGVLPLAKAAARLLIEDYDEHAEVRGLCDGLGVRP